VDARFEVAAGAADAVEHRAVRQRRVVHRHEPAVREVHLVDDDDVPTARLRGERDRRVVVQLGVERRHHDLVVAVEERSVLPAVGGREVVRLVVVRVLMRHREQLIVVRQFVVQFDPNVLVDAGREVLAGAADAVEHRAVRQRRVVDRHEPALAQFDAVDDHRGALGGLVGRGDGRGDRHVRVVHDDVAVIRVRPVGLAVRGDERVRAVAVRILVSHRVERAGLDRRVEVDGHVLVGARLQVRARSDDAAEHVAIGERGVVDRHEAAVGERHLVDDDGRPTRRGVVEAHPRRLVRR